MFAESGPVLILTTSKDELRKAALVKAGAEVVHIDSDTSGVSLAAALKLLSSKGCNEVLVEAGPQLSGRLIELGLVNELLIYMAPVVLGADARSMFATPLLETMSERWEYQVHDVARCGGDVRLRFRRASGLSLEKVG
jgi:diaminohydroxyphosphoribosylaminopyrimidine deaminase/5-amino-6-(5-phosphoribosylamino)uracil reductase